MKSILLVEDNFNIIDNLKEFLELEGFRVLTAANGETGVSEAKKHIPDLIICDVLMNGMNGHEVLKKLLDCEQTKTIPFIFSTSLSEKIDRFQTMQLGADDYIVKPYELKVLLSLIHKWLDCGTIRPIQAS